MYSRAGLTETNGDPWPLAFLANSIAWISPDDNLLASTRVARMRSRTTALNGWRREGFSAINSALGLKIAAMANTRNRNICAPPALIPARAPPATCQCQTLRIMFLRSAGPLFQRQHLTWMRSHRTDIRKIYSGRWYSLHACSSTKSGSLRAQYSSYALFDNRQKFFVFNCKRWQIDPLPRNAVSAFASSPDRDLLTFDIDGCVFFELDCGSSCHFDTSLCV